MIPLTDERLRQLAYDDMVCTNDNERAMAVELLAARVRIAWMNKAHDRTVATLRETRARMAELEVERRSAREICCPHCPARFTAYEWHPHAPDCLYVTELEAAPGRAAGGAVVSKLIGSGVNLSRRLSDGSMWPALEPDDDLDSVEWKLRYSPKSVTQEDMLYAASVMAAYQYLVYEADRDKVALVRRELRAGLREARS